MTKTFGRRGDCQSVVFATGGVVVVVVVCVYGRILSVHKRIRQQQQQLHGGVQDGRFGVYVLYGGSATEFVAER